MRTGPPRSLPYAITGRDEAAPATLLASAQQRGEAGTTAQAVIARRDRRIPVPPSTTD